MSDIDIVWIGPNRFVPRVGELVEGMVITIPENLAKSFIKQGLAKKAKKSVDASVSDSINVDEEKE